MPGRIPGMGTNPTNLDPAAAHERSVILMKFLHRLAVSLGRSVGDNVYVVGGAARDFVLGRPIKDVDLVIDSVELGHDSEWFADQVIASIPARLNRETNQYGVVLLKVLEDWELDGLNMKGEEIEIANARTESYTKGGYKPTNVAPSTIREDVERRELTYNTLLIRLTDLGDGPVSEAIIDLTGQGLADLAAGRMQCPAPPDKVFSDDPSRMIRVIKFAMRYAHQLTPETLAAIHRNAHKIRNIPGGHLINMMGDLILKAGTWAQALQWMGALRLLSHVRDIAYEDQQFCSALGTHLKGHRLEMLFGLQDLGFPVGQKVQFLSADQQLQLRGIVAGLGQAEGWDFLGKLKNPGNAVGDKRFFMKLASQHGFKKRDLGRFNTKVYCPAAQELLFGDPSLADDPVRFRRELEAAVSRRL